jgi:periplasmic divalent cation tolerance protein
LRPRSNDRKRLRAAVEVGVGVRRRADRIMTSPNTDVRLALTTAPDRKVAETLAETLVGERLAACATILDGATSVYRWNGKVERASEVVLLLKTGGSRLPALKERLLALHPYETPEFLAFDAASGSAAYLAWVVDSTTP